MSHLRRLVFVPVLPLGFFIACSQMPSDEVVAMRIKASYFSDPLLKSAPISVSVDRGRVTLSGSVPTAEVELKAFKLALHTDGVRNLNDNLTVDPPVWRAENVPDLPKPKHAVPLPSKNEAPPPLGDQPSPVLHDAPAEPLPVAVPVFIAQQEERVAVFNQTVVTPTAPPSEMSILNVNAPSPPHRREENGNAPIAASERRPISLIAAGSVVPTPLYQKWFSAYRSAGNPPTRYQPELWSDALRLLTDEITDVAATDTPASEARTRSGKDLLSFPTVVSGVVPSYNLPGVTADINFTPAILAGIYLGFITRWNDADLAIANQGVNLPDLNIAVIHRSDPTGTTYCFTDYLSKRSADWLSGIGRGTSVDWPLGLAAKGDEGVAARIRQQPGALGYLDLTYALNKKMAFGKVENREHNFIKASLASLTAAAATAGDVKDSEPLDLQTSLTDGAGPNAYPIAAFSWLVVSPTYSDARKSASVRSLLDWIISNGQTQSETLNYARLPDSVLAGARKQLALLH